ncbi:hypothetical protein P4N68_02495 [Corynebacterium felinum]|uniref:ATP-grasp domain-containing protein n=1 Tax=Corynebacterium felinum TaxID=131318 RepID=A0ABU2B846_9CORY|nr:hypothetical protein [Corynebacterium felinum]MDF5819952.1 hypothetical protein [Corynebacterium felinum]MDR7354561.1 hypothetical protein [Corynebacterium felinum]WJY93928.1 argininosuccinate lyase [Corynebacterium felinum]
MTDRRILLAIEAMSEVDEMAVAADKHGYQLRVLAEDPAYYDSTHAEIVKFPTRDHEQLHAYVAARRSEISQVFSVTDTWGVVASKIRDAFGFYQFGDTTKLEFFRDKEAVQSELIALKLAQPSQSWPKIMKLRSGTGKMGVHLVSSEEEASAVIKSSGFDESDYVKQDFYLGPTYSAEVWRDATSEIFFGVTNRIVSKPPLFTERVKSFPWAADSVWEERVKAWVFRVLDALGYDLGLAHVEFIETTAGFELVEINPRMAGSVITPGILKTTHFNPYAMAVHQALNTQPCEKSEREILCGFSHVSLYASRVGIIKSIKGLENIHRYPGQLVCYLREILRIALLRWAPIGRVSETWRLQARLPRWRKIEQSVRHS